MLLRNQCRPADLPVILFSSIGVFATVAAAQPLKLADVDFFENRSGRSCRSTAINVTVCPRKSSKGACYSIPGTGVKRARMGRLSFRANPMESVLIKAISYSDDKLKMPPKTRLPDAVVANLTKWVAMGAPDPRDGTSSSTSL